jgi:hypothetical protein
LRLNTLLDDIKIVPQNPSSPKKPLAFALYPAGASLFYSLGYRGKHSPSAPPFGFVKCAEIFVCVYFVAFVVIYALRRLGVPFDRSDK